MKFRWPTLRKNLGLKQELENLEGILPDYAWVSLGQLLAEYRAILVASRVDAFTQQETGLIQEISDRYRARTATWSDMYTIELLILRHLPVEEVRQRLATMKEQFRQMVGKATFDSYSSSLPDLKVETNIRAAAEALTFDLYRLYALTLKRDVVRRYLARLVLITTGILVIPAIIFMVAVHIKGIVVEYSIPTTVLVLFAGIVGGLISLQRRLQSTPENTDPLISLFGLSNASAEVMLAPLSGALFALLLYVLFISGLVKGSLFPDIYTPHDYEGWKSVTYGVVSYSTGPVSGIDFGKLLVWSFIAGFAERFVPDTLDRLVQKSQAAEQQANRT